MNTTSLRSFAGLEARRAVVCLLAGLSLIPDAVALPPPVITAHPISQTVPGSGAATFVVHATSATPLSYQWYFQTNVIAGATTNFYTRTNAQLTHAGAYYARVSNANGTVNSSNGLLIVNDAPSLSGANNLTTVLQNDFQNAGTIVSGLITNRVTDPNAGALQGIAIVGVSNTNGTWQYSTNDGSNWSPFGSPSAGAGRLLAANTNSRLRFVPATNFIGTITNGLTFRAWDQTSGTNGGVASTLHTTNTVLDRFSTVSYGNNDGSQPWSGNWVETGSSGPGSGNIRIVSGTLQIVNANPGDSIYREANLSGVSSAALTFSYTTDLSSNDSIVLQASTNGGGNYVTLGVGTTNTGSGVISLDITAYAAANTRLRILVQNNVGGVRQINIDNFQINYTLPGHGFATACSSNIANASVTVVPAADVITTLSGPSVVAPLTEFTYAVTVSNAGPSAANSVAVSAALDSDVTFITASAGGTYLAGTVTWPAIASLGSGARTNLTVTVRSPTKGKVQSSVSSTSTTADPESNNNDGGGKVKTSVSALRVANTSSGASVSTLNWSHTVSPGSARILIVGVSIDNPNTAIIAATFANLLPLTLLGQTNGAQSRVAMYYLLNPPVGTFPISITLNAAEGIVGGATSLNGVSQADPFTAFAGRSGTSALASLTVVSTLGGLVIDTVAPKSPTQAVSTSSNQIVLWNHSSADYSGAGSSSSGEDTVTTSWTLNSSAAWAMAAVALNPALVLADVGLTVTGPSNAVAGSNLTYVLTVTNHGPDNATNLVVSDALPAGAAFVSASRGGTFSNGVVNWPVVSNFASGATSNYTITITAPGYGPLTNLVYSTAVTADPDPANNNGTGSGSRVITTVTTLADISATVLGPASVLAGTNFTYTLTIANNGPWTATGIVVSDTLPAGATFVSASNGGTHNAGTVTWSVATLISGAATNFTVTVTAPASGTLINVAASASATSDPVPSNNNGSAAAARVITTVTPLADVITSVTGPTIAITNVPFSYTVSVANSGPSTATSVEVNDTLPGGATFVSASAGGTHNAGVVTWSLSGLANGAVTNLTVTVIAPLVGSLLNTVASSAVTADPDTSNNNGTTAAAWLATQVYPFLLLRGQRIAGGFQVEFHARPDTSVSLLASTNLAGWLTLIMTNSGDGHVIFVDQDATNHPARFYRGAQGQ